ncbi:MAG: DUF4407 domain-containing protein [Sphingobacteriales bacterium]|nr:DUF4407 domain-containing protein [Sphingobacteriales bacterium]
MPTLETPPTINSAHSNAITRFFWWSAGARTELLEETPSEQHIYFGIGATIVATALLAFLSGSYALYTIFKNPYLAIGFGILWALVIFNFDRFIVASLRKKFDKDPLDEKANIVQRFLYRHSDFIENAVKSMPRFFLAMLIGLIISKPLELRIFQGEVAVELKKVQNRKALEIEQSTSKQVFYESDTLKREQTYIATLISNKEAQRNVLQQQLLSISNKPKEELHTAFYENKRQLQKTDKELENLRRQYTPRLQYIEGRLVELEQQKTQIYQQLLQQSQQYDGLLARLEALELLEGERFSANWWKINLITLLFILIETAPVLVKLFLNRGNYDYKLHLLQQRERHEFEELEKYRKDRLDTGYRSELDLMKAKNKMEQDRQMEEIKAQHAQEKLRLKQESKLNEWFWKEMGDLKMQHIKQVLKTWEKNGSPGMTYQELLELLEDKNWEHLPEIEQIKKMLQEQVAAASNSNTAVSPTILSPTAANFDMRTYIQEVRVALQQRKMDFVLHQTEALCRQKISALHEKSLYWQKTWQQLQAAQKAAMISETEAEVARKNILHQIEQFLYIAENPPSCLLISKHLKEHKTAFTALFETTLNWKAEYSENPPYETPHSVIIADLTDAEPMWISVIEGIYGIQKNLLFAGDFLFKSIILPTATDKKVCFYNVEKPQEWLLEVYHQYQQRCFPAALPFLEKNTIGSNSAASSIA